MKAILCCALKPQFLASFVNATEIADDNDENHCLISRKKNSPPNFFVILLIRGISVRFAEAKDNFSFAEFRSPNPKAE